MRPCIRTGLVAQWLNPPTHASSDMPNINAFAIQLLLRVAHVQHVAV